VEKTVTLTQVMAEIKTGRPFEISFVTADRKRGKGGEIRNYAHCSISRLPGEKSGDVQREPEKGRKAPRHFENDTINIQISGSREIRKIHPRLIIRFNGNKVI